MLMFQKSRAYITLLDRDMAQSEPLKSSNLIDNDKSETLDRLSELPINLICHILGFLSTKCAVATCVLAKRWKYKWMNVPVLDFTDLPSTNSDGTFQKDYLVCFRNFMNRVLLLNEAPCLERARFEAYDCLVPSNAFEWLRVIARRSVKELYLHNKIPLVIGIPAKQILAKEELVVLKLERLYFDNLSCFVHLPCLRILSLEEVMFDDDTQSEETKDPLTTILNKCPILEELNIDRCTGFNELSVESSSLKILNLVSRENKKIKVTIKTPNLESLHLAIGMKQSLVDDFPSLVDARLEVWCSTVRWVKLLQKFRFIKTLVLFGIILDGRNKVGKLPTFENLAVLEVAFSPWPIVLQILENSPHLKHLSIQKLMFDWPNTLPNKALSLEEIECHCFNEVEEGISIIQFFLTNSKALKELKIHLRSWMDSKSENEVIKLLLGIPRASNQCKISIVNGDENTTSDESDSEPGSDGIMRSSEDEE